MVESALNTVGAAVGSFGRAAGETLTNATDATEQATKSAGDQVHRATGAKQQSKMENKVG